MSIDRHQDFFALLDQPRCFRLDVDALEAAYHELHVQVHPDRHAHLPDADKRRSMQWATRVNEAFVTLRKPLERARYLLELAGVDAALETNTAMSTAFLMEQMEWREAVEDARTAMAIDELETLFKRLRAHAGDVFDSLAVQFDDQHDYAAAAETVRRLMFIEKLQEDINDALEALEN